MKSRTLFLTVSMFLVTCCMLYGQSPEKPWRAFKLGINYVAISNNLPKMLGDHQQPFGIFTPTFQWGKTNQRWTEVSIPFLILNRNQKITYDTFVPVQPEIQAPVTGNLKAHFESGLGFEQNRLTGKSLFKIPSALGFGASFMYGKYTFNSNEAGLLDFKSRAFAYRIYLSYKLIKTYKHVFFDFQTQLANQGLLVIYNYQLVGNQLPTNTQRFRRYDGRFQYALGLRFGIGYRW